MAHVKSRKGRTVFLPSTRLSTSGMNHIPDFDPPVVERRRRLVLISRLAGGRRLSWPRWLGEILRWFARPKTVTHPSISRGGRESNPRPSNGESNALTTRPRSRVVLTSLEADTYLQQVVIRTTVRNMFP